ncbi:MAG: potassium channel family protein [Fidelibacterota bacterium]
MELQQLYHRIREAGLAFGIILIIGSVGYKYLGTETTTMFDGLYMTILTVSTIGFEEVIELDNNFLGRIFTIFIAFSGIGILTFILSNFAALFIEGGLREKLRIRKMEKMITKWTGHFIVCGLGQVGLQTAIELETTRRKYVFADSSPERIRQVQTDLVSGVGLTGDCTDDEFLLTHY